MKTLNFFAASVAILSSLAVAAPVDTKREELYAPSEDLYSKLTLEARKDKREELYGPSSDLYSVALLRGDDKRDTVGTEEA
ncbi:hypothetical protein VM1G_05528 [Cytospora mali]|uniref:Uncharacterized protein n=1 Tax=Cytospora mali TaxID=578113 RepID=A0A194W0Q7_CYTMA|nr:hypothetical protein VM1G_05528 [Valsa mali]